VLNGLLARFEQCDAFNFRNVGAPSTEMAVQDH
jgi:hypothetical protein